MFAVLAWFYVERNILKIFYQFWGLFCFRQYSCNQYFLLIMSSDCCFTHIYLEVLYECLFGWLSSLKVLLFFFSVRVFLFCWKQSNLQRYLVKHSLVVEKIDSLRKLRHLFLFSDVIVCAKQKLYSRYDDVASFYLCLSVT